MYPVLAVYLCSFRSILKICFYLLNFMVHTQECGVNWKFQLHLDENWAPPPQSVLV